MKNILYLLSLALILVGCEKYELETYPTLDGTYLVSFIRHDGVNTYVGYDENNTTYDGIVPTGIGDLNVGTDKVSFSGTTFYMGYEVFPGGDDWSESYPFEIYRGVDGYWDDLEINHTYNFIIEEDGLEHILLKYPNQQLINGEYVNMWIKLSRVGP